MLAGQATPVRAAVRLEIGRLHSFTDYYFYFEKGPRAFQEKAAGEPAARSL
jgi:hypothetical protein